MKNRKAQSGTGAASLLVIIAGLIILYVLFIPPAEREKILEGEENVTEAEEIKEILDEVNQTLVLEYPGTMTSSDLDERTFDLPSLTIGSKVASQVLETANTVFVESSVFRQKTETLDFEIENVDDIEGLLLSFNIKDADGMLIIELNGKEIYANKIDTSNIPPIDIKKSYLEDGVNSLVFSAKKPKFLFWTSNSYILENVQVVGSVSAAEAYSATSSFFATDEEATKIQKARLRFTPDCIAERGKMSVRINNNLVFDAIPDCGVIRPITFNPDFIDKGQNDIDFKIAEGSYFVDNIAVILEYKEQVQPTYYFELEDKVYEAIDNESLYVNLTMTFADDIEDKTADIIINNRYSALNQEDDFFSLDITRFVKEGNNALKIVPKTTLEVVELRVELLETEE